LAGRRASFSSRTCSVTAFTACRASSQRVSRSPARVPDSRRNPPPGTEARARAHVVLRHVREEVVEEPRGQLVAPKLPRRSNTAVKHSGQTQLTAVVKHSGGWRGHFLWPDAEGANIRHLRAARARRARIIAPRARVGPAGRALAARGRRGRRGRRKTLCRGFLSCSTTSSKSPCRACSLHICLFCRARRRRARRLRAAHPAWRAAGGRRGTCGEI